MNIEENEHPKKGGVDVITISSDDDNDRAPGWDLTYRPWKHYDKETRFHWEMMYSFVTSYPMHGDWEMTETFQREQDKEMMR